MPKTRISVGRGSTVRTEFLLVKGRVGMLDVENLIEAEDDAVVEISAKVHGTGNDSISIKDRAVLRGKGARGLLKSRIAGRDTTNSEVISEIEASAPRTRGHMDCVEIVQGNAKAKAVPTVNVLHEEAQVTHEAAVGRIDQKEIETLMARGLDEDAAVDIIIGGMLQ